MVLIGECIKCVASLSRGFAIGKTATVLLFVILAITVSVYQRNVNANHMESENVRGNRANYDNYCLVRVNIDTLAHVDTLHRLEMASDSCIFYGHARQVGQQLTIMIAAHRRSDVLDLFQRSGIEFIVLVNNIQEAIDREAKTIKPWDTLATAFDWDHYFHLRTINEWMEKLANESESVEMFELPTKSWEGRTIRGVRIAFGGGDNRPAVFVEAGIHAREWIAPATATFLIQQLIELNEATMLVNGNGNDNGNGNGNDGDNDKIIKRKQLMTEFVWYVVPVLNVDGYVYTFEQDRLWRKNRKPFGLCRGVDLNRNFDDGFWNGTGSSGNSCHYDFAGSSVFSEPEAQALSAFVLAHTDIRVYVALHSFSQLVMFPYGHTADKVENYSDLKAIGERTVAAMHRRYSSVYATGSIHEVIYPSSGGSSDWAYAKANIPISFTIELRGPPNSTDLFILPAAQIRPTALETFDGITAMLQTSKELNYFGTI